MFVPVNCTAGVEEAHEDDEEERHPGFGESPGRYVARQRAYERMLTKAKRMQDFACRRDGVAPGQHLPVGSVVMISIADVDRAKTDSTSAAAVVVEIVEVGERGDVKYRLACANGVLKSLRARSSVKPLPKVTAALMGLDNALSNWKEMPLVGDRACSRMLSMVGGQGLAHCMCQGKCDTWRCSCFKLGRECNSRCHKSNSKCCNKLL